MFDRFFKPKPDTTALERLPQPLPQPQCPSRNSLIRPSAALPSNSFAVSNNPRSCSSCRTSSSARPPAIVHRPAVVGIDQAEVPQLAALVEVGHPRRRSA